MLERDRKIDLHASLIEYTVCDSVRFVVRVSGVERVRRCSLFPHAKQSFHGRANLFIHQPDGHAPLLGHPAQGTVLASWHKDFKGL